MGRGALGQKVETPKLIVSLPLPVKEQWQEAEETAERLAEVPQEVISTLVKTKREKARKKELKKKRKRMIQSRSTKEIVKVNH